MSKLLIIDTETGGLDPAVHSLLSLAAVVWHEGHVIDSLELMVAEPDIVVDAEALAVNALDVDRVRRQGLTPAGAVEALERLLREHFSSAQEGQQVSLAGHNVYFDVAFLRRLYRLAGRNFAARFSHRHLDTASVAQFLMLAGRLPLSVASSDAAFAHFGIAPPPGQRHTALGDALATAQLLNHLLMLVR